MNLKSKISELKTEYNIENPDFDEDIVRFLVTNDWFGEEPTVVDDEIQISENSLKAIEFYCKTYGYSVPERIEVLSERLKNSLPYTHKMFTKHMTMRDYSEEDTYALLDFLCFCMSNEINEITTEEMDLIIEQAYEILNKRNNEQFIDFVNWVRFKANRTTKKARYLKHYNVVKRSTIEKDAYKEEEYLKFVYTFYNADSIRKNQMYEKAVESYKYANAWLFLSLHFVCALRDTDQIRIEHPTLTMKPEEVLEEVKNGTFSDEDAIKTLYSIYFFLEYFMLKPNKTKKYEVPKINMHIPVSVEAHIGKLLAILEAHHQINGTTEEYFIKPVKAYEDIKSAMGDEIGELFIDANFRSRSSNKSFMQLIEDLTEPILGREEFHIKGYMLAALARSHKGNYGDYAKTTVRYLKDFKFNGLTPEFVAKEMLERGVLSFVPMMLLEMVAGEDFKKLSVKNQTKAITSVDMSLLEIEQSAALAQDARNNSSKLAKEIYETKSRDEIINILHRIGSGQAVSNKDECMCMLSAMKKDCPYLDKNTCIGCPYEISTKSTVYMLANEYKRLSNEYKSAKDPLTKSKSEALLKNVIIPKMSTIVSCAEEYNLCSPGSFKAIVDSATEDMKRLT